jgi:tetratricopeptide (TPR) repeat protein
MRRYSALLVLLMTLLVSRETWAQGERFGAVAGTWAECAARLAQLRKAAAAANETASERSIFYRKQRLAIELDKCVQLADAPAAEAVAAIYSHREAGFEDRALALTYQALARYGHTAELDLLAGQLLYARKRYVQALRHLLAVLDSSPNNLSANQLVAAYYYERGELERAVPHLRVVADAQPSSFEANAALGDACLTLQDLECVGQYLGIASRLRPTDLLLAMKVGELERRRGEYGGAIEAYERVLKTKPDRSEARLGLGLAYAGAGLLENAQTELVAAAESEPEAAEPALQASRVLRRLGRGTLGVHVTERALAHDSGSVELQVERILALVSAGDARRAARVLGETRESARSDDRMVAAEGDVYLALGEPRRALQTYQRARSLRPKTPEYAVREARALRLLGLSGDATALLERCCGEEMPESVRAELLASLLDSALDSARVKRLPEAGEHLTRALKLDDTDAKLLAASAAIEATLDHANQARALLAKANPSPERERGEVWLAFSEKQHAKVLDLTVSRSEPALLMLRAISLDKVGRYTEGLSVLESIRQDEWRERRAEWHGYTLAEATRAAIQKGSTEEAVSLVTKRGQPPYPKELSTWLYRVPLMSKLKNGEPVGGDVAANYVTSLEGQHLPGVDAVLEAAVELSRERPKEALKILAAAPARDEVARIRSYALVALAGQLVRKGDAKEARTRAAEVTQPEKLPAEARLNILLAQANVSDLADKLREFVGIPAALYDLVLVRDRVTSDGSRTVDDLQKLLETGASDTIRERADALFRLKQRLYR